MFSNFLIGQMRNALEEYNKSSCRVNKVNTGMVLILGGVKIGIDDYI